MRFCDIQNNRILGKWLSTKPKGKADNTFKDLDYLGHHEYLI